MVIVTPETPRYQIEQVEVWADIIVGWDGRRLRLLKNRRGPNLGSVSSALRCIAEAAPLAAWGSIVTYLAVPSRPLTRRVRRSESGVGRAMNQGRWVSYDKQRCASLIGVTSVLGHHVRKSAEHRYFLRWNMVVAKVVQCQVKLAKALQAAWRPMHSKAAFVICQLCSPSRANGAFARLLHQWRNFVHKPSRPLPPPSTLQK